jgi:sulfur-oxidizing protein SoxB
VVAEEASKAGNRPVWKLVEAWLKSKGSVGTRALNTPCLIGIEGNPGLASV